MRYLINQNNMENPFQILNDRLDSIESQLVQISILLRTTPVTNEKHGEQFNEEVVPKKRWSINRFFPQLEPINKFCKDVGMSRTTLWRLEKEGKIKLHRIGCRVFVDRADLTNNGNPHIETQV